MDSAFLASLLGQYRLDLSIYTFVGIMAVSFVGKQLMLLVPAFKEADDLNAGSYKAKMAKPNYAANQAWNRK